MPKKLPKIHIKDDISPLFQTGPLKYFLLPFKLFFKPFLLLYHPLRRFVPGFKKLPVILQKTLAVILTFTTFVSSSSLLLMVNPFGTKAEAAWFNDNWAYRQEVPITANASADNNAFFSFTLDTATLITNGQLQSSCQDIRVTDGAGNVLPYHVGRTNACNNASTTIDALAPFGPSSSTRTLPAGASTYYVYYGNPTVASKDVGANFTESEAVTYTVGTLGSAEEAPSPSLYWKFDEGQGTTVQDSTANNADGLRSGPSWETEDQCVAGKCLYFGGATLDVPTSGNDITIDTDVSPTSYDYLKQTVVWKSSAVGYVFYSESTTLTLSYRKTTDAGNTWGAENRFLSAAAGKFTIWYDRWTPNDSGTKIHLMWRNVDTDAFQYANLDTSTDTFSSPVTILAAGVGGVSTWDVTELEITKAEGGNLYVSFYHQGTEGFYRSTDSGASWSSRTMFDPVSTGIDATIGNDEQLLIPAATSDTNDIAVISWGWDVDTISVAVYDDSANTWGSYVTISTSMADDNTFSYQQFSVSIRHSDKHAILAAWSQLDNAAADLKVFDITLTSSTPSVSTLTDVISNTSEAAQAAVFIDNNSDDIYVAYLRGTNWTAANAAMHVYYKKSTDGGTTWGSETQLSSTADDIRQLSASFGVKSGDTGRFMPVWINDDLNDMVTNYSTSVPIPPYSAVIGTSTVNGIQTISFWVKPNNFSTTTVLFTINGTAIITTNSSGVVSASGFTSPTIYINGQTGTTLSANIWQQLTITTGTPITGSGLMSGTDGGDYLIGFMDDVKIYSFALSASQIKANYNARGNPEGAAVQTANIQNIPGALSNGLVGYWKLDETSGNASDSSGNSTTLTDGSSTTYTAGKFNNGADLEASSTDYLYAADNSTLSLTGSVTLSAWIKPETVSAGTYNILGKWDGSNESYRLMQNADEIRMEIDSNGNYQETSSSNLATGTWYHVTGVYDAQSATVRIYINGALATSTTTGTIPSSIGDDGGRFQIGAEDSTGGVTNHYDGIVDEVRVYNRALSGNDASKLYNWAPGPVAYWKMDEASWTNNCSTATVLDSSTNGLTGTACPNSTGPIGGGVGKFGKGGVFDGVNDYVEIADNSLLKPTSAVSFSMWIKFSALSGNTVAGGATSGEMYPLMKQSTTGLEGYNLYKGTDNLLYFTVTDSSGSNKNDAFSDSAVVANQWYHIEAVFERPTVKLYINGALQSDTGTHDFDLSYNSTNLNLGRSGIAYNGFFMGTMDDVKIYNYGRTASQALEDMNAGHPAPGSPIATPLGYWKFDEGYGTTANNSGSAGSAGNGTLTDMATAPSTTSSGWSQSGKFGKALSFDGTNDYVNAGTDVSIQTPEQMTSTMWAKFDSVSTDQTLMARLIAGQEGFRLYMYTDGKLYFIINNSSSNQADSGTALSTGTWYHIAVQFKPSQFIRMYINGKLVGEDTSSVPSAINYPTQALRFGTVNDGGNYFDGMLDEIKMYNQVLDANQIAMDMNRGSGQVLGNMSDTNSVNTSQPQSAASEYCVPGDTISSSCATPILRWDFEEGSGTTAFDTSGNGNTGTLTNTPTYNTGKIGKALYMNGSNQYVNAGSGSTLDNLSSTGLTVEAWVYTNQLNNSTWQEVVNKSADSSPSTGWLLEINGDNDSFGFAHTTSGTTLLRNAANNTLAINTWYHLAATWTGSLTATNLKLYVNGKEVSSYAASQDGTGILSDDSAQNLTIGCSSTVGDCVNGRVDNVRVFNYARTPAQVAWDYNRGAPIAHWKMDECQGTTLNDSAGNSNSATLTITTTSVGTCTTSSTTWGNGASGKRNYSVHFDGDGDVARATETSYTDLGDTTSSYATSAWIKTSTDFGSSAYIVAKDDGTASVIPYILSLNSSEQACFQIHDGTNNPSICGSTALNDGNWHHLVGIRDVSNDQLRLYVDGQSAATAVTDSTTGTTANNDDVSIGNGGTSTYTTFDFTGQIDDAKIFNYPPTATQIKSLYNEGAARYGPSTGAP